MDSRFTIQEKVRRGILAPFVNRKSPFVNRGFTLIETLVAIAVLLTAIVGPLSIAAKGLSASLLARDQITAFYLAQEGVEYIRGMRDENVLGGRGWLTGLKPACTGGQICNVSSKDNLFIECDAECPLLKYDAQSGFYGTQTGENSRFRRTIRLEELSTTEALVAVTISWTSGLFPRMFTVREVMTDWGTGTSRAAAATAGREGPPPGSYHTLSRASYVNFTLSSGGLQLNRSGAAANAYALLDFLPQTGKWYFEMRIDSYSGSPQPMVGLVPTGKSLGDSSFNQGGNGFMYNMQGQYYVDDAFGIFGAVDFGSAGSVIAIAYDANAKKVWIGGARGGGGFSWINRVIGAPAPDPSAGINPFDTYSGDRRFAVSDTNNGGSWQMTYNFGQGSIPGAVYRPSANGSFVFEPPAGFSAITN